MRATSKRMSELTAGTRGTLLGRSFTVLRRWPEDRGPGYTDVRYDDDETHSFCWDYENPEVRVPE